MARIWNGDGTAGAPPGRRNGNGGGGVAARGAGGVLQTQAGLRRVEEIRERVEREVRAAREAATARAGRDGGAGEEVGDEPGSASTASSGWETVPNTASTAHSQGSGHVSGREGALSAGRQEGRETGNSMDSQHTIRASDSEASSDLPISPAVHRDSAPSSPSARPSSLRGASRAVPPSSLPARLDRRTTTERAQAARTALGAFVSEIAGTGVRAPSEQEIGAYVYRQVVLSLDPHFRRASLTSMTTHLR